MSQGRLHPRPPRALVEPRGRSRRAASARAVSVDKAVSEISPFRIGPTVLLDASQWHEQGVQQELDGDLQGAIASYRAALASEPSNPQVLFDLAYALANAGENFAAIERYRQVVEIDSNRQDAWVNLGDLLLEVDEKDQAIRALTRAVQLNSSDADAHFNLADAWQTIDPHRAAEHWAAFLRLAPNLPRHARYARIMLQQA